MANQLKAIADKIENILIAKGFVIQRYDATTGSVYLKLDFGVSNSIRISNHDGKKHLQYRYNVIIGGKDNIIEEKYIRYFFNENSIEALIMQILIDRKLKVQKYGKENYRQFMVKNMNNKSNDKGFWTDARIINDELRLNENDEGIKIHIGYSGRHTEVISDATVTVPKTGLDPLESLFRESAGYKLKMATKFKEGFHVNISVPQEVLVDYYTSFGYSIEQASERVKILFDDSVELEVIGRARFANYDNNIYYKLQVAANVVDYLPEAFLIERGWEEW